MYAASVARPKNPAAIQRWVIWASWAGPAPDWPARRSPPATADRGPAPLELTYEPASMVRKASPAQAARTALMTDGRTTTRCGANTASIARAVVPATSSIAVPQWTTTDHGVFERA